MYPSTGFLRFGVPWLLVCALVVAYRGERPRRIPLAAAYALLGIASIWSLETALYAIATFAATALAVACMRPAGERLRSLLTQFGAGAAAILIAVGGLTAVTLAGRGEPPHVGGYMACEMSGQAFGSRGGGSAGRVEDLNLKVVG